MFGWIAQKEKIIIDKHFTTKVFANQDKQYFAIAHLQFQFGYDVKNLLYDC